MPRPTAITQDGIMADSIPNLHNHVFLGEGHERNERRTWTVIALCGFMMVVEIVGGYLFGSIALIADRLHMSPHARALLIGYEALTRFIWPVSISFNEAIPIAALGLIVNVASALLLSGGHEHFHGHNHHSGHHHDHAHADERDHHHPHHAAHRDNNLRAAVVHVAADAAVSILVIVGLTLGRLFGWVWMDPAAGLLGAIVIATWAYTLIRDTGAILLDMTPDRGMAERMRAVIETDGDRLTDLHLWRLCPGHLGVIVSVATRQERGPDYYQALLGRFHALSHITVEVQRL